MAKEIVPHVTKNHVFRTLSHYGSLQFIMLSFSLPLVCSVPLTELWMLNLSNLDVENPSETQVKFAATPGSHKQRHCTLVGHVPEAPLGFEIQGG